MQKKTLKLFISQPMHGLDDELILKQRSALKTVVEAYINSIPGLICNFKIDLIDQFVNVSDPVDFETAFPTERSQRMYRLGRSIQMMANADIVVFYGKWKQAKGCLVELEVAKQYGINFIGQKRLCDFCESDPKYNNELELLWPTRFDKLYEVVSHLTWGNDDDEENENENNKAR